MSACARCAPGRVRERDRYAAGTLLLPTLAFMENAGRGAAEVLARAFREFAARDWQPVNRQYLPNVVVICGSGHGGGGIAVAARHLDALDQARVKVIWTVRSEQRRGDAPAQFRILAAAGADQKSDVDPADADEFLTAANWIVDGLFGTGRSRPPAPGEPANRWVEAINRNGKPLLSLDLHSGTDADTGAVPGAAAGDGSASFVGPKPGFAVPGAPALTGVAGIVGIGVPRSMLRPFVIV